ncbi:salivary glue protein Sgs-3-like [Mytilus trossulus]|uniref:salivary glue protein Sgs-3-like n=1 Tax=Mytilus trossulus TaxID=6551 RepID=UPI00300756BE
MITTPMTTSKTTTMPSIISTTQPTTTRPTTTTTVVTNSTTMPTTTKTTKMTSTTTQRSTTTLASKTSTTTKSRKYPQTTTQKTTSHMRSTNIMKQVATVVNVFTKVIKATSSSIQIPSTISTSQNGDSVKLSKTSNVHKKTSGHICFKSEPVILLTTFFSILLFALGAVGGILGYKVIKTKNQLKVMDSSNESFNINSEK